MSERLALRGSSLVVFDSSQVANLFAERSNGSSRRSCSTLEFSIDVSGGPRSIWNKSAADVFAEDFLHHHDLDASQLDVVKEKFFTRVKSIKQMNTTVARLPQGQTSRDKVRNNRKYMVIILINLETLR